jgi:hypothetical protein
MPADSQAPAAPPNHRAQGRQLTGTGQQRQTQDSGGVHFSLWDRTPFGALLPGGGAPSGQQFSPGAGINPQRSPFQGANGACFSCGLGAGAMTSGTMGNRGAGLMGQPGQFNQMNLGPFTRAAVGMNLGSSLGGFKMSYTNGLNGSANGAGGVGKGSAQATFNSSPFDGMFNFSAGAMMGSSAMHGAFSSGAFGLNSFSNTGSFGTAPMGGGSDKRPSTSLTMRMSF